MAAPGFDQPGVYRITVTGHLDAAWSEILHDMAIVNRCESETVVTTVTGRLPDQAALIGVLNALYDRHVVVLAVETLCRGLSVPNPFAFARSCRQHGSHRSQFNLLKSGIQSPVKEKLTCRRVTASLSHRRL